MNSRISRTANTFVTFCIHELGIRKKKLARIVRYVVCRFEMFSTAQPEMNKERRKIPNLRFISVFALAAVFRNHDCFHKLLSASVI